MTRSDFQSLTVPKSISQKIEQYKVENGCRSKAQALVSIVEQMEKQESVQNHLKDLLQTLKTVLETITNENYKRMTPVIENLLKTILTFLQMFTIHANSQKEVPSTTDS